MSTDNSKSCWLEYLSPLKLTLLGVNAVCFGGCLVLLALGSASGPLVLLAIGTGFCLFAGLTGAIIAARRIHKDVAQSSIEDK